MKSTTVRGTIRFTGFIKGHKIKILIDGGSSDNFIQSTVVKFLHLSIYQTPWLKVLVGNGAELVISSQWLTILDTHLANYKECFLTFYINGELITYEAQI